MGYPNGERRNIVLLRPRQRDVFYLHYDNAVLRGVREMLNKRYKFVAIGRRDGRILATVKRRHRYVVIERV